MFRKFNDFIHNLSIGSKLGTILLVLVTVPMIISNQAIVNLYENKIIENARNNTLAIVEANNIAIQSMFSSIERTSLLMVNNKYYYDIFSKIDEFKVSDYLNTDRLVTHEISRQFSTQDYVAEAYIYTFDWLMGKQNNDLDSNPESVRTAGWDKIAHDANGDPVWITGYDYGQAIGSSYLYEKPSYEYRHLITMVREMKFQYSYMGSYFSLPSIDDLPVLVVHINERDVHDIYSNSISYQDSRYTISNSAGTVVSTDDINTDIGDAVPQDIAGFYGTSGHVILDRDGSDYILTFSTDDESGFFSYVLIPKDVLIQDALIESRSIIRQYLLISLFLCLAVALVVSQSITRPVKSLVHASERISTGDFSANTPVPGQREFKILVENMNLAETKINELMRENIESSIREKDTQLMALTAQINPHFLYNTLNTINLTAISNGDEETSELIISLSDMMQYVIEDKNELATVSDEISWLSDYLFLMSQRYGGKFRTQIDVAEDVLDVKMPKVILQPLAENSILHGFRNLDREGILSVSVYRSDDYLVLVVRDNGNGMTEEELSKFRSDAMRDGHYGIANVHRRLKLLYDDKFFLHTRSELEEGTEITLRIPLSATMQGVFHRNPDND